MRTFPSKFASDPGSMSVSCRKTGVYRAGSKIPPGSRSASSIRLAIATWWAWVTGSGEEVGRGRRGCCEILVAKVELRVEVGAEALLLLLLDEDSEAPGEEIRGVGGEKSLWSLPLSLRDSRVELIGDGGCWSSVSESSWP